MFVIEHIQDCGSGSLRVSDTDVRGQFPFNVPVDAIGPVVVKRIALEDAVQIEGNQGQTIFVPFPVARTGS